MDKKYIIKTYYPKENQTDKAFLKTNKQVFFDFLDIGYITAGLGNFRSCGSALLYKNTSCVRVGYIDNILIALAVYTDYQGEHKAVGYTATTDPKYREIGKQCLYDIIKLDIGNVNSYYWTMCSGSIEHLWDKFGGVKIPNIFVYEYIKNKQVDCLPDGFSFSIKNNIDEEEKKVIFGYNSKDTFIKVSEYIENEIDSGVSLNKIDESFSIVDIIHGYQWQLASYVEVVCVYGWTELPIKCINKLKQIINNAEKFLKSIVSLNYDCKTLKNNLKTCKELIDENIHPLKMNIKLY